MAAATSPTKTGWKRVSPPPIKGSAGSHRVIAAKRLKKSSSGPNTMEGRMITAAGTADKAAFSPAALLRAYCDGERGSAPIAETCTSLAPASAAALATAPAPFACTASKVC